jgi:hypothetical protein
MKKSKPKPPPVPPVAPPVTPPPPSPRFRCETEPAHNPFTGERFTVPDFKIAIEYADRSKGIGGLRVVATIRLVTDKGAMRTEIDAGQARNAGESQQIERDLIGCEVCHEWESIRDRLNKERAKQSEFQAAIDLAVGEYPDADDPTRRQLDGEMAESELAFKNAGKVIDGLESKELDAALLFWNEIQSKFRNEGVRLRTGTTSVTCEESRTLAAQIEEALSPVLAKAVEFQSYVDAVSPRLDTERQAREFMLKLRPGELPEKPAPVVVEYIHPVPVGTIPVGGAVPVEVEV